jgi:hypothetical protein
MNVSETILEESVTNSLTKTQKEIVKLLQNKGVILSDKKSISIAQGNKLRNIAVPTFVSLIDNGIILRRNKSPFNYLLSSLGKMVRV